MTFDPKLSETVSLSGILDGLLAENEKPDTVMSFLEDCGSSVEDVISGSIYSSKITCLDFFRGITTWKWIPLYRRIVEEFMVDPVDSWLFVIQLSKTGQDAAARELGINSQEVCHRACMKSPMPRIRDNCLDELFLEQGSSAYYVVDKVNGASNQDFKDLLDRTYQFLFEGRFFQDDVFTLLHDTKKFIVLNFIYENLWVKTHPIKIRSKFLLQLLCGNDEGVKSSIADEMRMNRAYMAFDVLDAAGRDRLGDSFELNDVVNAVSFPDLYMKYAPFGIENFARTILVGLLMYGKYSLIKEFEEFEPELVEKYLPVGDVARNLLESGKGS